MRGVMWSPEELRLQLQQMLDHYTVLVETSRAVDATAH